MERHRAYERFVLEVLVPYIYQDCGGEMPITAVGCSLGTVMSRLHYARKHMQKLLKDAL